MTFSLQSWGELPDKIAAPSKSSLVSFYVHYDSKTLDIKSVSTKEISGDVDVHVIEIDSALARRIMGGEESIVNYMIIGIKDGTFQLHKKTDALPQMANRVDVAVVIQQVQETEKKTEINFCINKQSNIVEIHYHGERIKKLDKPVKFYFTRKNDPSFLKCFFQLDVNILNEILTRNELSEWPNPIRLKVDNAKDLSIYEVKGQLSSSIKYGKIRNNRV